VRLAFFFLLGGNRHIYLSVCLFVLLVNTFFKFWEIPINFFFYYFICIQ
jgi:hypothetical protein